MSKWGQSLKQDSKPEVVKHDNSLQGKDLPRQDAKWLDSLHKEQTQEVKKFKNPHDQGVGRDAALDSFRTSRLDKNVSLAENLGIIPGKDQTPAQAQVADLFRNPAVARAFLINPDATAAALGKKFPDLAAEIQKNKPFSVDPKTGDISVNEQSSLYKEIKAEVDGKVSSRKSPIRKEMDKLLSSGLGASMGGSAGLETKAYELIRERIEHPGLSADAQKIETKIAKLANSPQAKADLKEVNAINAPVAQKPEEHKAPDVGAGRGALLDHGRSVRLEGKQSFAQGLGIVPKEGMLSPEQKELSDAFRNPAVARSYLTRPAETAAALSAQYPESAAAIKANVPFTVESNRVVPNKESSLYKQIQAEVEAGIPANKSPIRKEMDKLLSSAIPASLGGSAGLETKSYDILRSSIENEGKLNAKGMTAEHRLAKLTDSPQAKADLKEVQGQLTASQEKRVNQEVLAAYRVANPDMKDLEKTVEPLIAQARKNHKGPPLDAQGLIAEINKLL